MSEDQPLPYIPDYARPEPAPQPEVSAPVEPTTRQEQAAQRFEDRIATGQYDDGMTPKDFKTLATDYVQMVDPNGDGKLTGAEVKAVINRMDPDELREIKDSIRGDFEKVQQALGDRGYAELDPKDQATFRGVIGGTQDPLDVMYADKAVLLDRNTPDVVGKMAEQLASSGYNVTNLDDGQEVSSLPAGQAPQTQTRGR